ncbi:alpha/beta fold hydrolase [Dyadobacter sp.]|uniref:alpha/beta fold hydrolase n=1 Tax=Dyadobacter sp. TaxID=1914288 RepID=UPI003F70E220
MEKNKADSYQMLSYALPAYIDKLDLQELPGAGHFIQEEMPVETAEFISTFLG